MRATQAAYAALESKFKAQVQEDREKFGIDSEYLPNRNFELPADFVLVGMEPGIGITNDLAAARETWIDRGAKNWVGSTQVAVLNYCAEKFLPGSHYITDVAKGAMKPKDARRGQAAKYRRWYPLLREEIEIVAKPKAPVIAMGGHAYDLLRRKGDFVGRLHAVRHYSTQAAKLFGEMIPGREPEYDEFKRRVDFGKVISLMARIIRDNDMDYFADHLMNQLQRSSGLTESRKKLMFDYKVRFGQIARG